MKKKLKIIGKYFLEGLWIVLFLYFIARLVINLTSYKEAYQDKNVFESVIFFLQCYFIGILFGLFALFYAIQAGFLSYKIDQIRSKLGYSEKLKKSKVFLFFILKAFLFLPIPLMMIYPSKKNIIFLARNIIGSEVTSLFIDILILPFFIIFLFTYLFEKFLVFLSFKKKKKNY